MDNEEIKKLLQELKKNSDESSAVRSEVVKIHFDTPAEAARRRKAKEKAEAEAARKRLEEEEKARAAEEARNLEAERMAQEVVEEAKLQAKSGFSPDLEQDLLAGEPDYSGEEAGENAYDLDLNWEYERPRLTSDDPYEESADDAGPEEDPDYMEDSDEFREGIIPDGSNPLKSLLKVITGWFASLTERLRERGPKEESQEESAGEEDETADHSSDTDTLASKNGGMAEEREVRQETARAVTAGDPGEAEEDDAAQEEEVFDPDEEWKRRMEEPPKPGKKRRKISQKPSFDFLKGFGRKKDRTPEEYPQDDPQQGAESAAGPDSYPGDGSADEEYPDAGIRADEYPKTGYPAEEYPGSGLREEEYAESGFPVDEYPETGPGTDEYRGAGVLPDEYPETGSPADEYPEEGSLQDGSPKPGPLPDGYPESAEGGIPEKSIKVIDLDEKTNSREAEEIPLDTGSTGPLPRLKAGRFLSGRKPGTDADPAAGKKKKEDRGRLFGRKQGQKTDAETAGGKKPARPKEESGETWNRIRQFASEHRKQILIGLAAALALVVLIAALALIIPRLQSKRRAVIREDEGLTVQILSQPDEFTPEGDISLRIKAPETIQSVTINGENTEIEQGRTVDLNYHARTGALEVMVVSTDKVRSADITLAYVDSAPPVVSVSEKDGRIELTAEDSETGVKAIYIGKNDGLSDVPMFEEYTEPIPADPDEVISYYAVDEAGNASTPVMAAMTPAESIAFSQNRYGIFPGAETALQIVTEPENAFVNNLTFEIENDKVAKISGSTLTGVSEGDTKITASADGLEPVTATVSVKTDRTVTISAVGDCTFGTDINLSKNTSFDAYQAMYGNSYFFENVRNILSQDDATFANFEGTLTTSDERKDKPFAFKGDPSYASILTDGSIEVVTLANNHSSDYGDQSKTDTQNALEAAGVEWCEGDHIAYKDLNGVKTAFIGIYALENGLESMDQVKSTVAEAKENGADLVVMHFHWGIELVTALDEFETQLAHAAIDAGADLVLGTHAHMILPIEKYNGRYIVYGLSNFCFGGNAYPHSYESIIWQQTFTFTPDGLESEDDIRIIPCRISSDTSINNYQPTPVSGEAADAIMQTINDLSAPFGQDYSRYLTDGTALAANSAA